MLPIITQDAIRILSQAKCLIEQIALSPLKFEHYIGSHLRHIIEHYEALLNAKTCVDYDSRARDLTVQANPNIALARIELIQSHLQSYTESCLNTAVTVRLCCGALGESVGLSQSTIGRELLFVSSHATHHYALIKTHCASAGVMLSDAFGKAPATMAHEVLMQTANSEAN